MIIRILIYAFTILICLNLLYCFPDSNKRKKEVNRSLAYLALDKYENMNRSCLFKRKNADLSLIDPVKYQKENYTVYGCYDYYGYGDSDYGFSAACEKQKENFGAVTAYRKKDCMYYGFSDSTYILNSGMYSASLFSCYTGDKPLYLTVYKTECNNLIKNSFFDAGLQ